jgi:hypothetical protein
MTAISQSTENLYNRMFGDEDARVCKDIPPDSCNDQPKNFFVHVIALSMTKLGDKLIDPKITLAWLLTTLGAPSFYIALLVPIRDSVALLPQLLIARMIRKTQLRKWWWVAGSIGQAIALLFIAGSAFFLTGHQAGMAIIVALVFFSAARGVCSVATKDVMGKTVSKTRRGRVSGLSETLAGSITLVFALGMFLTDERSLQLVIMLIVLASALWMTSAAVFSQVEELAGATEGGANALDKAGEQFGLLWRDPEFGKFVFIRSALLGSALAAPYLVVLATRGDTGSIEVLAALLMAASLAGFISGSVWGSLADRSSSRCLFLAGNLAGASGLLAVFFAIIGIGNHYVFTFCLFMLYLAHAGVRVGRSTHLVDMANQDNRAAMVAVSNTVIGALLLVMAGVGAAANTLHSHGALLLYSLMALSGAWMSVSLKQVQS